MAVEFLNEGAVSFAAANWNNGAGGAGSGIADNNDFVIEYPFGPLTGELDQSALTVGVESIDIRPGAVGVIGGSAGAFIIDADASVDAFVANYGNVTLYLTAGGGSSTINEFSCGTKSINYLIGGTVTSIVQDGGFLNINASTIVTTAYINKGETSMAYHATDATLVEVNGGNLTIKRMPTTLTINGGTVTLDPDDSEGFTSKTINMKGGRLIWRAGAVPTANIDGGVVDFSNNRRAFAPGATAGKYSSAATIISHPNVDESNITARGASKTAIGGPTPL